MISVVISLCFAFWAPVAVFPSEVLKLLPVLIHERVSESVQRLFFIHNSLPRAQIPIPKSFVSFIFMFYSTSFWGDWFAFLEVYSVLPEFGRCSVRVVLYVDIFLMYLWGWGGWRWFPCVTPSPPWKSPIPCFHWGILKFLVLYVTL